jgi:hypothetical protein
MNDPQTSNEPEALTPTPMETWDEVRDERSSHGVLANTWELELVISGAVVFALMQLPGVLNHTLARLRPHLVDWQSRAVLMTYTYVSAAVYTLIIAFLLHLAARAYWIGLIGLDAVFPQGVQWERLRYGPTAIRFYRERLSSIRSLIVRLDKFCSVIFAFASLIVLFCVVSITMVAVFGLIAYALSRLFFAGAHVNVIFFVLIMLFALPSMLISTLDRKLGPRLPPESPLKRAIDRYTRFSFRLPIVSAVGPVLMILLSNVRRRALFPLFGLVFLLALLGIFAGLLGQESLLGTGSLPENGGAEEVSYTYYEDQRPEGEVFERFPSIQSDVIADPYIKLFIPYSPERHEPILASRCPQAVRMPEGEPRTPQQEARARAVLRCLADFHRPMLDGKPLPGLQFQLYTHPETGVRGILGFIPTQGLLPGKHLLQVQAAPHPDADKPPAPYRIPFWR